MIALTGVRLRSTFDHSRQPGTAPSRENAYVIRDIEVTQPMPQKNCPIVEMPKMTVARVDDSDEVKMAPTKPPSALTASTFVAANRNDSSRTQPPIAE